jgi:diguanylate cyclase (GGDEF)-like protein
MSQAFAGVAMPHDEAARLAWLARMIEATTPDDVGEVILDLARTLPGVGGATLLWPGDDGQLQTMAGTSLLAGDTALAAAALQAGDGLQSSADGRRIALRLLLPEQVALLLDMTIEAPPPAWLHPLEPCLQLAAHHLRHALKLADLHDSHKQLERSENLQRALFAISDLAGSDLDMPELLRGIHAIVSTLMYAENFFIVRYDAERATIRFLYYADVADPEVPDTALEVPLETRRDTLTWYLITRGKALMGTSDQLQRQVDGPLIMVGQDSFDWLGVPMLRDGLVHGALVVQTYDQQIVFTLEDRALLEFVGSHILTALERKQTKDELEQRVHQRTQELAEANQGLQQEVLERQRAERLQAALFHLAQLATADIDEDEFYERVHSVVGELLNAENFFIALLSTDQLSLDFPYYVDAGIRRTASRTLGAGLSEYVLRRGQPLRCTEDEVVALGGTGEIAIDRIGRPAKCWLGVPLFVGDEVIGLVVVQSYTEAVVYHAADQELLSFAALQIANSIYRRRSAASLHRANAELEQRVEERTQELRQQIAQREEIQQQLKHQVMHDPLTGLPNRGYLRDRLDRVLALIERQPKRRCALLYLDVDRFKVINDSLGHLAGDEFLKAIASRLQHCVREPDVVARLSGDEFAILLEDVEVPAAATNVARRVLETLGMPLQIAGKELEPSVSMGIACGDSGYHSADELLRDADIALYRAKELGRKRFAVFDETLAKNMVDVLTLESELRQAMQQGQFEPYFQPISRLGDGQIVGYEALIRWNHPRRGVLRPGEFLKIAQDGGHIETIDWHLFDLACEQILQLPDKNLFLTFNVSALHLRHADFDRNLMDLLQRAGLSPTRLVVEVTEGSLLDDPERVRAMLDRLRMAGVGAALDDFGTGYSSLSYLHSLPLRILKIDRAFVDELDKSGNANSTTVVAAILALARALDIQVIAEGIETEAQREALMAMGCELGQGYLLGRPAPIEYWLTASVDEVDRPAPLLATQTR